MKISFWQRWFDSPRNAKRKGRASRARPRRQPLHLEPLEDRVMLSLTPQMVLDINANTWSSNPSQMVAIGSATYFTADDGVHGIELWKSDGTEAGTRLVKDIYPGSAGSFYHNGYYQKDWLTNVNGTLFFTANDGTNGWKLWKSDGSEAGTVLVNALGSSATNLTNVNGTLFFSAYQDATGWELWKSDGSAAGTTLVKDVKPSWESSNPSNLTNVNGTLFFSVYDYFRTYSELWKSDGTAAGTVLVKSYAPKPNVNDAPRNLTNVNGTLFFSAYSATTGSELWKSDGTTAGTVLVKDIQPGSTGFYPSSLTNVNGTLFFSTVTGAGLWKSDGTAAGTTLVKNISYPSNLTNVNGTLFFSAEDGTNGRELWRSDGTAAGTVLVKDISPNSIETGPSALTNVNGTLYFAVSHSNVNGTPSFNPATELWKSDGTESGTVMVMEFNSGSPYSPPGSLTSANGMLMFTANDSRNGVELWQSDGSAAGTTLVKDINARTFASYPGNITDVNGTLFFAANDGVHGSELWKSDGTVAGTTLVKDIFPGSGWIGNWYYGYSYQVNSSSPSNLTNVNGTLFFTANDGRGGWTLWKSDGTDAGTTLVSSLWYPSNLTNVNGTLFFTANDADGQELWKSDGTTAGTTLVKDIYPGSHREYGYYGGYWYVPNSSNPGNLTSLNGTLFFTAYDDTNGRELWRSDGTVAGTVLVKDIRPGTNGSYPNSSNPSALTNVNGTLFFTANDGSNGAELWRSDGTDAGTVLIKDIRPGAGSSDPYTLSNVNGTLFFTASDGTTGSELWRSDGTDAGTVLVKDIRPGSGSSGARYLTNVNGTLFFSAYVGTTGWELWRSDGTAAGTVLVQDLQPGSAGSYPGNLTYVNGKLFFTAYDDAGTSKLWQSDGTAAGTVPVANLLYPSSLTSFHGALVFAADDGVHGKELWTLLDDGLSSLTIDDVTLTEGHTGTRSATFTVTLSAASDQPVTVAYATAAGTATAGSDYQALSGTLTFAPGNTSKTITVLVYGDRLGEPDETFFVNLSGATNAAIGDGQGVGAILDDEPRIRISDMTMQEGNSGTTPLVYTVSLSTAYDLPVTVAYATADSTATAGSDYQPASGTLTIAAGQTTGTITVLVKGDRLGESNETFFVNLSGPINATIADGQAVGTIVDDEPRISISDVSKSEGKKNQSTLFTFTVSLSAAYDQPVTMSFQTVNGTATTGDSDYVGKTGTLTFAPGETMKTITIEVKGDSKKEGNETFYLDLFGLSSNALFTKNRGIGTILNDD